MNSYISSLTLGLETSYPGLKKENILLRDEKGLKQICCSLLCALWDIIFLKI